MAGEKILIVDDEREVNNLIKSYLLNEGFVPLCAYTGEEAMEEVESNHPDLIILDFMLPDIDGPELCLDLRKVTDAPVIFLSCRSEEIDKIVSLSSGGDDYITKPFLPMELIARIKANLRRYRSGQSREEQDEVIIAGNMTIDISMRTVMIGTNEVNLTAKEFDILLLLAQNPKRFYSADQLFKIVWKTTSLINDPKTVTVHMSALRKKIEIADEQYIISTRGVGYKFNHSILK